jgi:hypothetical protein
MAATNPITFDPKSTADQQAVAELRRASSGKPAGPTDSKRATPTAGAKANAGRKINGSPRGGSL